FDKARDARKVYEADREAFRDHWNNTPMTFEFWSHHLLESDIADPSLWMVAVEGDEVAGVSINAPFDNTYETGFIYVLAVRQAWRKKGLGRALLLHTFAEFKRRGYKQVDLNVDEENITNAVALYKKVGMTTHQRLVI